MGLRVFHGDPPAPEIVSKLLLGNVAGLVTRADLCQVGGGQLIFDDPDGTVDIQAQKRLYVNEDLETAGDIRVWFGYVGKRTIQRRAGASTEIAGAGRVITVDLDDANKAAQMRIFTAGDADADRPSETVAVRGAWLMSTSQMSAIHDGGHGYVDFPSSPTLDATNYQHQKAVDVLLDLAKAVEYNAFVFYCETDAQLELFFNDPNANVYVSPLSLSNVKSDVDNVTIFAPSKDFVLERSPDRVYSGIDASGKGVKVYRQRAATITEFYNTDTSISEPNISSLTELTRRTDQVLATIAEEDDRLTGSVELPSSKINDIKAGQRLLVRFSHMGGFEHGEDYSGGHWTRVKSVTVRDLDRPTRRRRRLDLELTPVDSLPSGAFDHYGPGDTSHTIPTLPHETVPGQLLVAAVTQGYATGQSGEPTVQDGDGTNTYPWTQAFWVEAQDTTQYGGPGNRVGFGMYWRRVAVGETTMTPLEVVEQSPANSCEAYLWEFDTASDPGSYTSFTTGVSAGTGVPTGTDATIGSALSGFILGGLVVQEVDYEYAPVVSTVAGRQVQNTDSLNIPWTLRKPWNTPWQWIGSDTGGGPLKANLFYNDGGSGSVVNRFGCCGGAIELPGVTLVPTIPYPANQVG